MEIPSHPGNLDKKIGVKFLRKVVSIISEPSGITPFILKKYLYIPVAARESEVQIFERHLKRFLIDIRVVLLTLVMRPL